MGVRIVVKIGNNVGECAKGSWSSEGYLVLVNLYGRDGVLFRTGDFDKESPCWFSGCDRFLKSCGIGFGARDDLLFKSAGEALDATRGFVNNWCDVTVEELRPRIRKVRLEHSLRWLDEVADYGSPDLKGLKRVCRKCGHDVVEERVLKGYPFYCPRCYENKFSFETEFAIDERKEKEESNGQD